MTVFAYVVIYTIIQLFYYIRRTAIWGPLMAFDGIYRNAAKRRVDEIPL